LSCIAVSQRRTKIYAVENHCNYLIPIDSCKPKICVEGVFLREVFVLYCSCLGCMGFTAFHRSDDGLACSQCEVEDVISRSQSSNCIDWQNIELSSEGDLACSTYLLI